MSPSAPARFTMSARTRALAAAAIVGVLAVATVPAGAASAAAAAPTSAEAVSTSLLTDSYPGPDRDFNGDGYPDVLAVASNGDLRLYTGTAAGPLAGGARVGTGWGGFTHVFATGDFSGDGLPDVMARDGSGNLFLYRGDGASGWLGGSRIGTGWQGFNAILSPGDFNSDGTSDVIARDGAGRLFLYPGDGAGGWLRASQIGTGWGNVKFIVGAGDMNDDWTNDLTAVTRGFWSPLSRTWQCGLGGADLYHYFGTGSGGFAGGALPDGSGWCKFTAVIGGDQAFIARDASGNLWRYERGQDQYGNPAWAGSQRIGTGWSGLRLVG